MKNVVIYTTEICPYCIRAKRLLDKKGVPYREIRVDGNLQLREELIQKSGGRRTVPQIFVENIHVGDCDELHALERAGKLDPLLQD